MAAHRGAGARFEKTQAKLKAPEDVSANRSGMAQAEAVPLVDCHVHLQDARFGRNLPDVLRAAAAAGIRRFLCNGTAETDWAAVLALSRRHPEIIPSYGVHPWHAGSCSPGWEGRLEAFLEERPSAVGEIGLDRWIEPRDEALQERVFRAQLAIAVRKGRPVTVHCLRAWDWLLRVLRDTERLPPALLIHAYGGSPEMIAPLAALGAWFSFAGNVFEPKRERARAALQAVPRDRLLLETDAPDLAPPPPFLMSSILGGDGRPVNEPANLRAIFQGVAALLNEEETVLAGVLWANAERFLAAIPGLETAALSRGDGE